MSDGRGDRQGPPDPLDLADDMDLGGEDGKGSGDEVDGGCEDSAAADAAKDPKAASPAEEPMEAEGAAAPPGLLPLHLSQLLPLPPASPCLADPSGVVW